MNKYVQLKEKHQNLFNAFPISFAFNHKQFAEGMKSLGLSPEDKDKVVGIGGGGFIRKKDKEAFNKLIRDNKKEMQDEILADKTGEGFIKDMFLYELANHEYAFNPLESEDESSTSFIVKPVAINVLSSGLKVAIKEYLNNFED